MCAFLLQDRIQACTLGHKRWVQILERYNAKMAAKDWILQHNGGLPPASNTHGGCFRTLAGVFCCARHPVEVLLNIDSRPSGFEDEPETAEQRRYELCVRKYGFQEVQNRSRVPKEEKQEQTLGYKEWRKQASQRASLRKVKAVESAVGPPTAVPRGQQ